MCYIYNAIMVLIKILDGECMKPIPLSEFCTYVEQMHANRDKLFEMEYTVS